mgnify:CR=1 FL=1|tara:strand:+ start:161 stop:538 length:378 start_codon:yes stop_codon:yes gene_type:complete
MSFVLKSSSSYSWEVSFFQPENGERKKQSFDALFKRLPQTRINEIQVLVQKRVKAIQEGEEDKSGITDQSIADEVLVGWDGIEDGEGNPVPFSNKSKKQVLEVPMLASAIIEAYFNSLVEGKQKN